MKKLHPHRFWQLLCLLALIATIGCSDLRQLNTAAVIDAQPRTRRESHGDQVMKTCYYYPVRDWFEPLFVPQAAWNVDSDGLVPTGSFLADRDIAALTSFQIAAGPCTQPSPQQPFTFKKLRKPDPRPSFFGKDATGRRFLVKVDHRDFPETASAAEVIATRLVWAMGYHVPANYLVTLENTGHPALDGRRAIASEFLPGKIAGQFKLDWLRYRREMRALRLVSAWVNDVDRVPNNCLVSVINGQATYFLLDFDSAIGSWQGEPKPPWRSKRYVWDVEWQLAQILTLGLVGPGYDPDQPIVSPAVGRFDADFDPLTWHAQLPNAAFDKIDEDDARWIVQRLALLTREKIEAAVSAAELSNPADSKYIVDTLMARRQTILDRWPLSADQN